MTDVTNHRVQESQADGEFILNFGTVGTGNGEFVTPMDVAIGTNGDIYVCDVDPDGVNSRCRIQIFRTLVVGSSSMPTGPFGTTRIALSSDGTLFAAGADLAGTSGVDIQLDNVTPGTGVRVNLDPPDLDPPDFDPPDLDPPDFDPPDSPVMGLTTRIIGSASGVAGTVLGSVRIYSETPVLGLTSGPHGPIGASTATAATLARYEITPDFSGLGSTTYRAEIYLNGALVATYPGHTGVIGADSVRTTIDDLGSSFTEDLLLTFRDNNTFTINPSTIVAGNQLRLVAEGVFATVDDRTRIELRGEGDSTSGFRILNVALVPSLLGAPHGPEVPTKGLALRGVWPNPSRGQTTMRMSVPAQGRVSMGVFDLAGRHVRSLANGVRQAGVHTMNWDGRDAGGREAPAGIYFVRGQFESGALRAQAVSGRFVLIR